MESPIIISHDSISQDSLAQCTIYLSKYSYHSNARIPKAITAQYPDPL